MSGLPQGWESAPIGNLCALRNGRAFKPTDWMPSGTPIVRIQNLNNPQAKFNYFNGAIEERFRLRGGELLFAWSGTPGTSFGAHVWNGGEAVLNQHIFRVDFDASKINKRFFRFAINQKLDELIGIAHGGAGLQHVTKGKFEGTEIWLPPLPEQTRIADKLDALLARVDAIRARLDTIPALLKRFRQSVLAAATSGELTEDWRGGAAAWEQRTVGEVAAVFLGRQRSPKNHNGEHMRKYVRAANVTWNGWNFSDVKEMNFNPQDFQRFKLRKNDILLNEGSGSADEVGKPAIWNDEIPDCCFQNTLICVRPQSVEPRFIFLVLLHAAVSKRFIDNTRGVNIYHIGKENMAAYHIALPPQDEQVEIVRRVESLFAIADKVQARYDAARARVDKLTPALLAKAFRGELVPQDPNDEPASALLERLRASKAGEPGPVKRGRKSAASGRRADKATPRR